VWKKWSCSILPPSFFPPKGGNNCLQCFPSTFSGFSPHKPFSLFKPGSAAITRTKSPPPRAPLSPYLLTVHTRRRSRCSPFYATGKNPHPKVEPGAYSLPFPHFPSLGAKVSRVRKVVTFFFSSPFPLSTCVDGWAWTGLVCETSQSLF